MTQAQQTQSEPQIPASAFTASTATLPKVNERDDLIAVLEADCARIKKMAWEMRDIERAFHDAEREFNADIREGKTPNTAALLEAHAKLCFGEDALLALKDSIEERLAAWNRGKQCEKRISVIHTAEGLPVGVSKSKHIAIWGI